MSIIELVNRSDRPSACKAPEMPVVTIGSPTIIMLVTMTHEMERIWREEVVYKLKQREELF